MIRNDFQNALHRLQARGYKLTVARRQVIATLFPMYQTSLILGMAMAESVALMGFVLVYLGHPVIVGVPFFVVCWLLQATKFPTFKAVVAPVEAATKATFRPD